MGKLVPLEIVLDLIKEAMLRYHGRTKGFIIDGYPSELFQGIRFEQEVVASDLSPHLVSSSIDVREDMCEGRQNTFQDRHPFKTDAKGVS